MTESVHVALLRAVVRTQRGVPALLEQIADLLLVRAARRADLERIHREPVRGVDVVVQLLELGLRWTDRERAREIAEIPAARLAGEDVDEQWNAGQQRRGIVSAVVRHAASATLRHDRLAAFESVREKLLVQETPELAERHRARAVRVEILALLREPAQVFAQLVNRGDR